MANLREVVKLAALLSFLRPEDRLVASLDELTEIVQALRASGLKIVLTMGTWDVIHVGHARYIREARLRGDILVVGVDDDNKARKRKGKNRPVVPQEERLEMLTHFRYVDLVILKTLDMEEQALVKVIQPDCLVAVEGTYTPDKLVEVGQFCGEVEVLPRQAETSTSQKVRRVALGGADEFVSRLTPRINEVIETVYREIEDGGA